MQLKCALNFSEARRVGNGAFAPCPPKKTVGTLTLCPPYASQSLLAGV
jgi:hypothetical protein